MTCAILLITLRNAQVRRISWVPVGFGRSGGGTSGLLMIPLPTGHLVPHGKSPRLCVLGQQARRGPDNHGRCSEGHAGYLILPSRNSMCFFATGSYFFFTSLSVMVREFLRVT